MYIEEIKQRFNSTEKLYHYTTFDSAIKILQSRSLLFGRLKDMNDINELYRPMVPDFNPNRQAENNDRLYDNLDKEINKYQQISLTMDGRRYGFDIPAMWGHYANKGKGVCLVFDKNKFVNRLKDEQKRHLLYGKIVYTDDFFSIIICQTKADDSIIPFTKKEEKGWFFRKTKDWQYEQEFRVLIKSDSESREKLMFQDSLIAVVMHNAESVALNQTIFDSIEFQIINKIISSYRPSIPVLEHCAFIQERLLITDGHTIWTSNPINDEDFASEAIEMIEKDKSVIIGI